MDFYASMARTVDQKLVALRIIVRVKVRVLRGTCSRDRVRMKD